MTMAETSKLLVELNLTGNFNQGIQQAEGRVVGFGSAAQTSTVKAASFASTMRTNVGGALSHASGQLKNLITGPIGLLGLGGALFTVGGAISHGLDRAREFGDEVRRLAALTGLSAEKMSALAAGLEHFGVGSDKATRLIGFLEKNVGLLAAKKDGIEKFQKTFGLALTDTNGKLKDANELILTSADYFNNKSIPATTKAAALSKIYGRSWQDLIPVLKAGRQGLMDAEAEAKDLGLTLTGDNVAALAKLKEATRDWGTALGGLELQIGLTLVPTITDLAKHLTSFVRDHRTDIVDFFKNAAKFAGDAAGTIGSVVGSISSFWNKIPAGFRDLLVKGLVADRTLKFLFGFSPAQLTVKLGSELLGGVASQVGKAVAGGLLGAGIGKAFVQPVFVTNPGFGGGAGGLPPAAGGGLGLLSASAVAAVAISLLPVAAALLVMQGVTPESARAGVAATAAGRGLDPSRVPFGPPPRTGVDRTRTSPDALKALNSIDDRTGQVRDRMKDVMEVTRKNLQPLPERISAAQRKHFDALRARIESSRIATVTAGQKTATAIDTEKSAIQRAIRDQNLAVAVSVKTSVSLGSLAKSSTISSTYSAGHISALGKAGNLNL